MNITELSKGIREGINEMETSSAIISESAPSIGVDSLKTKERNIAATICRPLLGILRQNKRKSLLFGEIIDRLTGFFSISRATLIISDPEKDALKVTTIWEKSNLRQGLWLTLPRKDSLLYRILNEGKTFSKPFIGYFPGNFIESRILMDKKTCSLVVCPLVSDKTVCGLISLASPVPFAFEMVEAGCLNPVLNRFGKILAKEEYENVIRT